MMSDSEINECMNNSHTNFGCPIMSTLRDMNENFLQNEWQPRMSVVLQKTYFKTKESLELVSTRHK